MTVDQLIAAPPRLHIGRDGQPAAFAVSPGVLRYLDGVVVPGQGTLETGAGTSTVLFAMKGARHTSIAPAPMLFARLRQFLEEAGVPQEGLNFVEERSEAYLPRLECDPFDLVLIDGRHAFPSPFIDWYYTEPFLKVGGVLVVDDIHIWTGRVLQQFLVESPEWALEAVIEGRSAAFRKVAEGSHDKFWPDQAFVVRRSSGIRSQVVAALGALARGRFGELRDMGRRFRANRRA